MSQLRRKLIKNQDNHVKNSLRIFLTYFCENIAQFLRHFNDLFHIFSQFSLNTFFGIFGQFLALFTHLDQTFNHFSMVFINFWTIFT